MSDTSLTINSDGSVTSAGVGLGQFLYGSQWNTQFRRPPVFYVNYPASGQFKVRTGGDASQSPKIVIWVDGIKMLEQTASVNQTYTVNIGAGQHTTTSMAPPATLGISRARPAGRRAGRPRRSPPA